MDLNARSNNSGMQYKNCYLHFCPECGNAKINLKGSKEERDLQIEKDWKEWSTVK